MCDKEPIPESKLYKSPELVVADDGIKALLDYYLDGCDIPTDTADRALIPGYVPDLLGELAVKDVVIDNLLFNLATMKDANNTLTARNEDLENENTRDPLTGIFNRRYFERELGRLLDSDDRDKIEVAVIDIDGLKTINDTLGHPKGDDAIIFVAQSINAMAREDEFIARIGGDEFVFVAVKRDRRNDILIDITTEKRVKIKEDRRHEAELNLTGIVRRILDAVDLASVGFCEELNEDEAESGLVISSSVGLATYIKGDTIDTLLSRADDKMYKLKELRKANAQVVSR